MSNLYPKTSSEIVERSNGKTVEDSLVNLESEAAWYDGWDHAIKMDNGLVILRYYSIEDVDMTIKWGVLYEGKLTRVSLKPYPEGLFIDNPTVIVGQASYGAGTTVMYKAGMNGNASHAPDIYAVSPLAQSGSVPYSVVVIGRWK